MKSTDKGSVLVVEDDDVLRDTLTELLRRNGWTVEWAVDGDDAIRTFRSDPADIILTDIVMPHLNGLDFVHRIREFDFDTPILVLTGYATFDHSVAALRAGANDFVTKPFRAADLLARLDALRSYRAGICDAARRRDFIECALDFLPRPEDLTAERMPETASEVLFQCDALAHQTGYRRRRLAIHGATDALLQWLYSLSRSNSKTLATMRALFTPERCVITAQASAGSFMEPADALDDHHPLYLLKTFSDSIEISPSGNQLQITFFKPRPQRPIHQGA